tara:strand:- start:214 stop:867 length:654 start_codon:yes stop_codon:yes gene_type:complete
MGFLDNSSITVDAILTKRGREILAAGGDLGIVKFALSDEEIDYTLYDVTHPNGSDSYGAVIENMSLLEATPNRTVFRSHLVNQAQAGAKVNVGVLDYPNVSDNQDFGIEPKTIGGEEENYIFTIDNVNIIKFSGLSGDRKTVTAPRVVIQTQSINTKATTTLTVVGEKSGIVNVITFTVKADVQSTVDPLQKQPRILSTDFNEGGTAQQPVTNTTSY